MNQTSGGSKFDIVFMSFGKENQKGIAVESAGEKDTIFNDNMAITAENSKLLENGNLETQKGNIIVNFADYKKARENNKNRKTEFAIKKQQREERKSKKDSERVG